MRDALLEELLSEPEGPETYDRVVADAAENGVEIGPVLGRGTYGVVFRVRARDEGEAALKVAWPGACETVWPRTGAAVGIRQSSPSARFGLSDLGTWEISARLLDHARDCEPIKRGVRR